MKNRLINTALIIGLSTLLGLNSCEKSIDPVVDELAYDRAFTPIGLKAQISNITTVTLTWAAVKDVDHYVVEIYQGTEFIEANKLFTTDVSAITLVYLLPSGDAQFSARLKSVSSVEGVAESNWTAVSFKSDPENLFLGFKVTMNGLGAITVKWTPGKAVTKLLFINNSVETSYDLSPTEITAGSKDLTGLTNGLNEIRVMNGTFVRGTQKYFLEGNVLLESGGDLLAAITAASPGDVIILRDGGLFGFAGNYTITKSIKIKGLLSSNQPTIYGITTASVYHMFTIDAGLTLSDSLVFENLNISGFSDNISGSIKLRGMFDQDITFPCNIGSIKFNNCIVRDFGRHAIRLRGTVVQSINNVEFNNCILFDYAWDSHYGVLNGTTNTTFANIKFTNSTIYNLRGGILNYGTGSGCQSMIVDNCTFDKVAMDPASSRYIIDFNTNTSTGTITVSDCIFGGSEPTYSQGIRPGTMTLSISNSYYTSDYADGVTYSIKAQMATYSGASTALWTNPVGGIFTFLDPNFTGKNSAGDPRWK